MWYFGERVIVQIFRFKAVPWTPLTYVWDSYNIKDKSIALEGFPIIDLVEVKVDYSRIINKYLM